jgi:hypothetical protein
MVENGESKRYKEGSAAHIKVVKIRSGRVGKSGFVSQAAVQPKPQPSLDRYRQQRSSLFLEKSSVECICTLQQSKKRSPHHMQNRKKYASFYKAGGASSRLQHIRENATWMK